MTGSAATSGPASHPAPGAGAETAPGSAPGTGTGAEVVPAAPTAPGARSRPGRTASAAASRPVQGAGAATASDTGPGGALAAIPPLRGPRPRGAVRARRRVPDGPPAAASRRSLLRGVTTAGTALGLAALGVFPPARAALARGFRPYRFDGYDVYEGCPPYASAHDCSPGCGPSLVCADCCRTTGRLAGLHHTRTTRTGFRLRPNECHGTWDGWLWRYAAACGACTAGVTWRCHDGWRRSGSGHWYKTICRWAVACDR